jgi:hypothetical protein
MIDQCTVSNTGYIFTNFDMADSDITILCTAYNEALTLDSLPNRYFLAFVYYVLHRHYMAEPDKANYYMALHQREWLKVHRQSPQQFTMGMGTDL